jgi:hypothetical protein
MGRFHYISICAHNILWLYLTPLLLFLILSSALTCSEAEVQCVFKNISAPISENLMSIHVQLILFQNCILERKIYSLV